MSDKAPLTPEEVRAEQKKQARSARRRRREVARLRREHKKRRRVLPSEERALLCTPDRAEMSRTTLAVGMLMRMLVAATATLGLTVFVCDALGICGGEEGVISLPLLSALIFLQCAALGAAIVGNLPLRIGGIAVFGAVSALVLLVPDPQRAYFGAVSAFNRAIDRLVARGFLAMGEHRLPLPQGAFDTEEAFFAAAMLFATVAALVLVPSLIKRVILAPPLILTVLTLAPIFTYNLTRGNLGVALVIASCAAMLVMRACDALYAKKPQAQLYDESVSVCPVDEPPLPETLARKRRTAAERRAERRAAREKKRRERDEARVSLDDELSDYFGGKRPRKADGKGSGKEKKKLSRAEKRRVRAEERAYFSHKKRARAARASAGGFAGAGALLLSLLILLLPAATVSGRFTTISAIDNSLQYYREYLTAILVGDSPALDYLAYDAEELMLAQRDTEATPQIYDGLPIMRVFSNVGYNVYLREWIGVTYEDGAWQTPDGADDLLVEYRDIFGTDYDPAETVRRNFYTFFDPELLDFDLSLPSVSSPLGVAVTRLCIERYNLATMNLYMPAYSLRQFNPTREIKGKTYSVLMPPLPDGVAGATYADYFDGVYTSYDIRTTNDSFAAVAMLTNMRSAAFGENLAKNIAALNSFRVAVERGAVTVSNSKYPKLLTLADGTAIHYRTYTDAGVKYLELEEGAHLYHLGENGTLVSSPSAPELPLELEYLELMTYSQRAQYDNMLAALDEYAVFVKDTYSAPAEGEVFSALLEEIADGAGIDLRLAASANAYNDKNGKLVSAVTDSAAYLERHRLAMAIVDYLAEHYVYTLEPTVSESELGGVEKFLTETREGYCVQFASALALLMREAGIPARYTEGYIASDLSRARDERGAFYADVLDEDKHAWVEVWFDGIGWIPYEATPKYYDSTYKAGYSPSGGDTPPVTPIIPDLPDTPDTPDLPDLPDAPDTPEQSEQNADEGIGAATVVLCIAAALAASAILAAAFFILRRARRADRARLALVARVADASDAEPPTREDVRALGDMISSILADCALAPATGQLRADYAASLAQALDGVLSRAVKEEGLSDFAAEHARLGERELARALDAVAAAEFGYGARAEDAVLVARLYRRLHESLYRQKVSAPRRAWKYLVTTPRALLHR